MTKEAEEWLALEDPTEGDLPATQFMGSTKDLSQTVDPEETDGTGIEDAPEGDTAGEENASEAEAAVDEKEATA